MIDPSKSALGLRPAKSAVADLLHDDLINLIELAGARLAWARAGLCPCANINDETDQPDPRCAKCHGTGFYYFGPVNYKAPVEAGALDSVQRALLADEGAAIIRGLVQRSSAVETAFDQVGHWIRGEMFVSVRPENVLGHYDRLTNLDAVVTFPEVVTVPDVDATDPLIVPLRYRAVDLVNVESIDVRYSVASDWKVSSEGRLLWCGPSADRPAADTRLSVVYICHPTWVVVDYPHSIRETPRRNKAAAPFGGRKAGTPEILPIQARIKLEFLKDI